MNQHENTCPNCQTINDSSSAFCYQCGTKLEKNIPSVALPVVEEVIEDPNATLFEKGIEAFSMGNLAVAESIFLQLGDYPDAAAKLQLVREIQRGEEERQQQELATQQVTLYEQGIEAFSMGNLSQAEAIFSQLGDYEDSLTKLQLVKQAQAQTMQANQQANIQKTFQEAQQTTDLNELGKRIGLLQQLGLSKQDLQGLEEKYFTLEKELNQAKSERNSKLKQIFISLAVIVVVVGSIGGFIFYRNHEAQQLAQAVDVQRAKNDESFADLPGEVQSEMKEMFTSYGANTQDFTYDLIEETADYTLIAYTFKGPDNSKDVLPKDGTRLYNKIAITRD